MENARPVEARYHLMVVSGYPVMTDGGGALLTFEAGLFDLVEQRLVADAEQLCRLAPVPLHLPQRIGDHRALGDRRCLTRHVGQPPAVLMGGWRRRASSAASSSSSPAAWGG